MGVSGGAEAAKSAGDATAAKGAADAGTAALADVGGAAATDLAATAALGPEIAASTAGAFGALDAAALGSAAAGAGALGGAGSTTAALSPLEEITITGGAPAAAGGGAGALTAALAPTALAATTSGLGTGSATPKPGGSAQPNALLPGGSGAAALSADTAQALGVASDVGTPAIDFGGASAGGGMSAAGTDFISGAGEDLGMVTDAGAAGADAGFGTAAEAWLKNPKNLATLGLMGDSLLTGLSKPKLPGAANTALNAAGPAVQDAMAMIKSGGMSGALWGQQKASIDASINQQIQQESEALQQAAANAGEGSPKDSAVVVQQINALKDKMETQRNQLYLQAQQQNVQTAIAELTGGNATLEAIAQMQLGQDEAARNAASETARLAMLLQGIGGGGG